MIIQQQLADYNVYTVASLTCNKTSISYLYVLLQNPALILGAQHQDVENTLTKLFSLPGQGV